MTLIQIKYPQHILAFDSLVLEDHFPQHYEFKDTVQHLELSNYNALMTDNELVALLRRQELETNEGYLQALPYIVIRVDAPDESKYFAYQRPSKGTGESRLAGLVSIGIGGHVELPDLIHDEGIINLEATLHICAEREKKEEVIIFDNHQADDVTQESQVMFTGTFLLDNSTPVGRVHIGIVGLIAIEVDDWNEISIKCLESGTEALDLYTAQELLSMVENAPDHFEPWTKALIYSMQTHESALHPDYIPKDWTLTMDGNDLDPQPEPIDRSLD